MFIALAHPPRTTRSSLKIVEFLKALLVFGRQDAIVSSYTVIICDIHRPPSPPHAYQY